MAYQATRGRFGEDTLKSESRVPTKVVSKSGQCRPVVGRYPKNESLIDDYEPVVGLAATMSQTGDSRGEMHDL